MKLWGSWYPIVSFYFSVLHTGTHRHKPTPTEVGGTASLIYLSSNVTALCHRSQETAINTGILDNWGAVVLQGGPYWHQSILRMYFKSPLESHLKTKKNEKKKQWKYWDLMIGSYPVATFCWSFSLSFFTAKLPHYRSSVINPQVYTVKFVLQNFTPFLFLSLWPFVQFSL